MKNNFIATVSHELKTPLASMRVLVDTLLEGHVRDEAQAKEYLRLTAKENERLSRMIDNFLTFSRMERNKVAFTLVDARPAAIASDAIESARTKFAAHNCHLTVDIADDLPEIQADHDAMVTVLVNLLDNACKYTTDDKRISLRIYPDDGFVCFAVSDNGIGLARRHLRRIFDRFYQVDSSLARKAEGCGLGLSIVKFIVDAHKGKITVESKPGKGSTFTVRLPVSQGNGNGKELTNGNRADH
jgi:signal transduction histidine kinase